MNRFLLLPAIVVLLALTAHPALADSLFNQDEDDTHDVGLYGRHPMELQIGDIVKVKIREKSKADVELGVDIKDEPKADMKVDSEGNLLGRLLDPVFDLIGTGSYSTEGSSEYKGDGKTDRTVTMDALVTAIVVDVLDNGYIIIEGRKQVHVNREQQTLVVRGMVDPMDLDADRVVESDMVADVEIEYIGEGQLTKKTKPGFISRVIDWIF